MNILPVLFDVLFSIPISFGDIGSMRGLLPFAGLILIVFLSASMSIHCAFIASVPLASVSLSSCRNFDTVLPADAIHASISFSSGMNGIVCSFLYFGLSHFNPLNFKKSVYATHSPFLWLFFWFPDAIAVFTSSGFDKSAIFANVFSRLVYTSMVWSANPSFFRCHE